MSGNRNIEPNGPTWGGDESKHLLEFAQQHPSVPRDVLGVLWNALRLESGPAKDAADAFVHNYEAGGLRQDGEAQRLAAEAASLVRSHGLAVNHAMVARFTPTKASIDEQFKPRSHFNSRSGGLGDGHTSDQPAPARSGACRRWPRR